jgi:hypothetical protein
MGKKNRGKFNSKQPSFLQNKEPRKEDANKKREEKQA